MVLGGLIASGKKKKKKNWAEAQLCHFVPKPVLNERRYHKQNIMAERLQMVKSIREIPAKGRVSPPLLIQLLEFSRGTCGIWPGKY